jgi:AcrR family transcriptional regulator
VGSSTAREGRREASAAETRQLVLAAALQHFRRSGYARATVNDIASTAGVAVPTVYACVGRKAMLLEALARRAFVDTSVEESLPTALAAPTGRGVIEALGRGTRRDTERHWETARVLVAAAGGEPVAAGLLGEARSRYHGVLSVCAQRLVDLHALRPDVGVGEVVDVLGFCLGLPAWMRLVAEAGWTWQRTEQWLVEAAALTLLAPRAPA